MTNPNQIVEARFTPGDLALKDLNSRKWDSANPITIDHYWSGDPAPTDKHAEARILWNDDALYVRYACNQGEPLVMNDRPQDITKTMYLWDRDVCEIFISPNPDTPEKYFEFEVAPTGEWLDLGLDWTTGKRKSDWQFNSGMSTAARIVNDRVTMAMRIPWNARLPKPQTGEPWRANLFRCAGKDPRLRFLSWQPTRTPKPFFHAPQAFGWLLFN